MWGGGRGGEGRPGWGIKEGEGEAGGRRGRGEARRPVGRDERDAARGGAERMHGGCRVGDRPPLDRPVGGGGAGLTGTPPSRRGISWLAGAGDGAGLKSERERERPRRGSVGRPAGTARDRWAGRTTWGRVSGRAGAGRGSYAPRRRRRGLVNRSRFRRGAREVVWWAGGSGSASAGRRSVGVRFVSGAERDGYGWWAAVERRGRLRDTHRAPCATDGRRLRLCFRRFFWLARRGTRGTSRRPSARSMAAIASH